MSLKRSSLMALVVATVVAGASYVKADVLTDTNLNNVATTLSGKTGTWASLTESPYYSTLYPQAQITAGLANAGNVTGSVLYKNAAITGAGQIVAQRPSNVFYGDEAYALAVVGTTFGPTSYATTATNFYNTTIGVNPGDPATYYAAQMTAASGSVDQVVQLAYLTVGAYKLGLTNAGDYRAALLSVTPSYILDANAGGYSAVAALGSVVWALGSTGSMGVTETGLLNQLVGRYDAATGGFYWALGDNTYEGGIFDQQFGIMALNATIGAPIAAYSGTSGINGLVYESPIGNFGVSFDGTPAYGDTYLAGAYLQAVPEPASLGVLLLGTLALAYRRKSR